MAHTWDPDRYLAYADERGRPFLDLIARIDAQSPRTVVDLGCGPGNLTALLAQRWPDADVLGLDSSPEMIAKASEPGVRFEVGDLREWVADERGQVDVLVSNATLQWVPGHLELLPRLAERVLPDGWLAFQVPGNFDEPSHTIWPTRSGTPNTPPEWRFRRATTRRPTSTSWRRPAARSTPGRPRTFTC